MRTPRTWLILALLLCAVTAAAIAIPSTLAYIAARSNTVHNAFRVDYVPPEEVSVQVNVHKTVQFMGSQTIGPGGFSFRLLNLQTNEATAMTTFADGTASLTLPFTAADVGQTYYYRLYEVDTGRENVLYDTTMYDIAITLGVNDYNQMTATIVMNNEAVTDIVAEFVNLYTVVDIPPTSDPAQPVLWLALLVFSLTGLVLLGRKSCFLRRS